jgi:hypothetical protein
MAASVMARFRSGMKNPAGRKAGRGLGRADGKGASAPSSSRGSALHQAGATSQAEACRKGSHGGRGAWDGKDVKSLLFLKKKKQKDFPQLRPDLPCANGEKFFGSFFSKKNRLLA